MCAYSTFLTSCLSKNIENEVFVVAAHIAYRPPRFFFKILFWHYVKDVG